MATVALGTTALVGSVTVPEICPVSCPCAAELNAKIANSPAPKTSAVRLRRRLHANCPILKLQKKRDMALMIVSSGELIEGLRPARFPKSFRSRRISSHFQKCNQYAKPQKIAQNFTMSIRFNALTEARSTVTLPSFKI